MVALVWAVAAALESAENGHAEGELTVTLASDVNSDEYPELRAAVSVIETSSGRPVPQVVASAVSIADAAGSARVGTVEARVDINTPVAFVFLLDTGGAMAPHLDRAREVLREVIQEMGPNDVARVVRFNEGSDEQGTNWVRKDDPNLDAQVDAWHTTDRLSLVVPALHHASSVANQAPSGYQRHAIVALVSVDGHRTEPGLNLETAAAFPTVTFAFGFGAPPVDQEDLPFFLEDLRKQHNGGYWPVDSDRYADDGPMLVRDAMHAVWDVQFRADGLPNERAQPFSLTVRDAFQRSGSVEGTYRSGTLTDVSPLQIDGISDQDTVESDREVRVELGGEKRWDSWQIQLFRDCRPDTCSPVAEVTNGALSWRLVAGPLEQGTHEIFVRVAARSGEREFASVQSISFERVGTGWNLWMPIAFLALGVAATVPIIALATRARRRPGAAHFVD